ncbi:hypothetical protein BC829DRAFT_389211 [Chytridium lagenaria]|nr:hypothetical protein BC829DRAFT_389211 [Chytridium lagenaria]
MMMLLINFTFVLKLLHSVSCFNLPAIAASRSFSAFLSASSIFSLPAKISRALATADSATSLACCVIMSAISRSRRTLEKTCDSDLLAATAHASALPISLPTHLLGVMVIGEDSATATS